MNHCPRPKDLKISLYQTKQSNSCFCEVHASRFWCRVWWSRVPLMTQNYISKREGIFVSVLGDTDYESTSKCIPEPLEVIDKLKNRRNGPCISKRFEREWRNMDRRQRRW